LQTALFHFSILIRYVKVNVHQNPLKYLCLRYHVTMRDIFLSFIFTLFASVHN